MADTGCTHPGCGYTSPSRQLSEKAALTLVTQNTLAHAVRNAADQDEQTLREVVAYAARRGLDRQRIAEAAGTTLAEVDRIVSEEKARA